MNKYTPHELNKMNREFEDTLKIWKKKYLYCIDNSIRIFINNDNIVPGDVQQNYYTIFKEFIK